MLDSFWISYMVVFVLSFARGPAFADDSTTQLMERASSITVRLNKNSPATCSQPPAYCPRFFNEVIRDDKSDGHFLDFNMLGTQVQAGKMIEGSYGACTKSFNSKISFENPKQMQTYAESNRYSQMGIHIHQAIRGCLAQNQPDDFNKTAKYYYAMGRLDQGVQDAQSELARIDLILGDQNSLSKCQSTFMDANIQCRTLQACPRKEGALESVAAQSDKDEIVYKKLLEEIKNLKKGCLARREDYNDNEKQIKKKGSYELCDSIPSTDGVGNGSCVTLTMAGLRDIRTCEDKEKELFKSLTLLEKVNPWFADEDYFKDQQKGESSKNLISKYLKKTRKALQELQKNLEHSAGCLSGTTFNTCDVDKLRENLLATRELKEGDGQDRNQITFDNYMIVQKCIESGANSRNEISSLLRTSGRDAALTVLTGGLGGLALKGAQWTGRSAEAYAISKNTSEAVGLLVGAFYFNDSLAKSLRSCLVEYDKHRVSLAKEKASPLCPDPASERLAVQKAQESCGASLFETSLNALPFAPLGIKLLPKKFRSATDELDEPSGWVDRTKRRSETTRHKTPDSPRTVARAEFIDTHLNQEFATLKQNEDWIALAENAKPDGKTKLFEVENSVMKELNDVTQDKNFVTAVTNKHKEFMQKQFEILQKKYPNMELVLYSDFKSMRIGFKAKPPAKKLPKDLEKDMQEALQNSNQEFAAFMKENKFVREGDKPEEWFRAGFGDSADQASLSARYSRNASGTNSMRSFNSADLQENLGTTLKATEMYRSELQKELGNSGLMSYVSGTNKKTLNQEIFDAIRKTKNPEDLISSVKKTTGYELSEAQAVRMRDYAGLVDEFSPSIRIAKKQVATLSDSSAGGLSLDFAGMGSRNAQGTADALAKSKDISEALRNSRLGEKEVTAVFKDKKEKVSGTIEGILKKHKIEAEIVDSGDDMVIRPNKPIPEKARQEITEALAHSISPSDIRVSHVPGYVPKESDRALLGTHGETIEKLTRKNLQGEIPPERLKQVLLMVDMKGNSAGNGSVDILTATGSTSLNDIEKQKIKRAFQKAVEMANKELKKENEIGNYRATGT